MLWDVPDVQRSIYLPQINLEWLQYGISQTLQYNNHLSGFQDVDCAARRLSIHAKNMQSILPPGVNKWIDQSQNRETSRESYT